MAKTCLVTGASRGLGFEIARSLLAAGHNVVATARSPDGLAERLSGGDRVLAVALDVTDAASVAGAVDAAIERFGGIDVLVNNAGHAQLGYFEMTREADIRREFDVNLFGPMAVTRAVLPHMRERHSGLIVTISSSSGISSDPGGATYASSKFALEGWIEGLAQELEPLGIKSLTINPGMLNTDFLDNSSVKHGDIEIADYTEAAAQFRSFIEDVNHKQPGDPKVLAAQIAEFVISPSPPARLVFGDDAHEAIGRKIGRLSEQLDQSADAAGQATPERVGKNA